MVPSAPRVKRSIGSLSCGDTIRRPRLSIVSETHEPSPGCELRSNWILKPGRVLRDSAGVAAMDSRRAPGALAAPAAAKTTPQRKTRRVQQTGAVIIGCIAVRRFRKESLQRRSAGQGVFL